MNKEIFVHRPHDYPGLIRRWKKIARVSRLKFSKVGEFDGFGVYEFRSPNLNQTDGIYMSAGIHGDEPGAVEGLEMGGNESGSIGSNAGDYFSLLKPMGL